jgi:hypothetical protein
MRCLKILLLITGISLLTIACGSSGGGGGNGNDGGSGGGGGLSPNETPSFTIQTSDANGVVSITLDSGEQGNFQITDNSGNPLQGLSAYIYKDNKGATIITVDPSKQYRSRIYSVDHFSTHVVEHSKYDNSQINVTETLVIPDQIESLNTVDSRWEKVEGKIDKIINVLDLSHLTYSILIDVSTQTFGGVAYLFSAIIFEDLRSIKQVADYYWSDDARYSAYINAQENIALVITQTQSIYGSVVVRAEDSFGVGISNASINSISTTAYNGYGRIDGISPGTYNITVSHNNYNTANASVDVVAGRTKVVEIIMTPSSPSNHYFSPDSNTVALWYLNGNGNDASSNGNDLAVKTDRVSWVSSQYGQGAEMGTDPWSGSCFNSDGGALTCQGSGCSYMGSGDWTVEGWVLYPSNSASYTIVRHYSEHWAGHDPYGLSIDNGGVARFYIVDSNDNSVSVSADISGYVNQWVHVAAVYRYQQNMELYVNGSSIGQISTTIVPETLTSYDVFVGGSYCGTSTGLKVDEVRISNTARY